ncbi:TniQ family protein [Brevibacillus sp. RS1.1]|uniref:TniQ family protein n=1 Tax=Brevibacillus sp. RS1.1 TaxID=2738982 RepID=UPI00156B7EA6|nr:TniQ family protein [Brevibacillus sp. RS1.1]NRR05506.1 TniQ family protein [Brevibacillus sp. RS1.1]
MLSGTSSIYESWDISIPQITKPSMFYSLEPIGLGTPYVESLTSYICRLAEAHSVRTGTLVLEEIIPRIQKYNSVRNRKALYRNSGAINNCGDEESYKGSIVMILEDLCQRKDLSLLTMSIWRSYISLSWLHSTNRKWCPVCFEEWRKMRAPIYEPLIWKIKCLKICPIHNTLLVERCTNKKCNKTNKHLGGNLNNGFCEHCNKWLGIEPDDDLERRNLNLDDEFKYYEFISLNLIDLLTISQMQSGEQIKKTLHRNIIYLKEKIKNKNLGQEIRKVRAILNNYVSSRSTLSIESLFFVCSVFGITMNEFINQKIEKANFSKKYEAKGQKEFIKKRKIDWKSVENTLEHILSVKSDHVPSLKQISKDIGIDIAMLRDKYPGLSREISKNYLRYKKSMNIENKNNTKNKLQEAMIILHQSGVYPSANRVANEIGRPAIMLQKEMYNYWKSLLCNLGYMSEDR